MKKQILEILRQSTTLVSGETLSSAVGTSRVSVWKHIRGLQAAGYEIEAASRGYRLIDSPDTPFPWEFPGREKMIHYFDQVSSTMDVARDLARKGCPQMSVVVAERQLNGRGRLKRVWQSGLGGLYFTIVARPDISPVVSGRLSFYAATVLARTLRSQLGVAADLKWPNDILVDGRKLCGMIAEMEAEADKVSFINMGVGINVNNDPTPQEPGAAFLKGILGRSVSRRAFLGAFLDAFEENIDHAAADGVIEEWKRLALTLGRSVKVVVANGVYRGRAVDVDPTGGLVLEQADGSVRTVLFGDCFHQE